MAIQTDKINANYSKLTQFRETKEKTEKNTELAKEKTSNNVKEDASKVTLSNEALNKQREESRVNKSQDNRVDQVNAQKIAQTDEARQKRIEELKDQIKNGQFKVDSKAIANRMISDTSLSLFTQ